MDNEAQKRARVIALEYVGIGVAVTTVIGAAFYFGMMVGFDYGIRACACL